MIEKRRIIAAWLLSVILPVVGLAPFHHHPEPEQDISCEACSRDLPHPGHLTDNVSLDHCIVCQLLTELYVPADAMAVQWVRSASRALACPVSDAVPVVSFQPSFPRAPPVSFCC